MTFLIGIIDNQTRMKLQIKVIINRGIKSSLITTLHYPIIKKIMHNYLKLILKHRCDIDLENEIKTPKSIELKKATE